MKIEQITRQIESSLEKAEHQVERIEFHVQIKDMKQLMKFFMVLRLNRKKIDKLFVKKTEEMLDLIRRKTVMQEIKNMKRKNAIVDYEELGRRLDNNPLLAETNKQVIEERQKELYEDVLAGKMSPLCYYRTIKHMSQEELAEKAKTTQSAVARAERVGYNLGTRSLKKYAKALGINPADLIS